ncbi:restriction endonuclease [Stetteria hydrogenophila]
MVSYMVWKGKRMEDLVEEMLRLRGFRYERNVRLRGRSGSLHEVDFLVYTSDGLVIYEVKNQEKPVPKEVVIEAYEVARDVGAAGAVVVSSSGFTENSVKLAKTLGVELIDFNGLLDILEASKLQGNAVYLEAGLDEERAYRFAEKRLKRVFLFIKSERIACFKCLYLPFYYFEGSFKVGENTYRRATAVASALSGLPVAESREGLVEAARRAALIPSDLLPLYARLAGRRVKSSDAAALYGEARWKRLLSTLESLGLAERVSRRPLVVRVVNDRPSPASLEGAASLFASKRAQVPARGCKIVKARLSPGASRLLLSGLYGFNAEREVLVYAPVYVFRIEETRRPVYRLLYLTGWLRKPLSYKPAFDVNA